MFYGFFNFSFTQTCSSDDSLASKRYKRRFCACPRDGTGSIFSKNSGCSVNVTTALE